MTRTRAFAVMALVFGVAAIQLGARQLSNQPTFVNGMAQVAFDVAGANTITHNVWVEVPDTDVDRDGFNDRIRLQVRRPAATESGVKLPIVMVASPYSGGTLPYHTYNIFGELYVPTDLDANGRDLRPKPLWPVDPPPVDPSLPYYDGTQGTIPNISTSGYQSYFLPRGFIFVYAQNLGTGKSTGCPTIGGVEENNSMKAVINWFNGIGNAWDASGNLVNAYWTSGNTTMIGTSYDGTLPLNAAVTGVPGLKAIVPVAGVSSYYDHRRSGGAVSVIGDSDSLMVNVLTRTHPERCHYLRDQHAVATDRTTGDFNAFWNERNLVKDVDKITAAVLISHGLNDPNVKMRHPYRLYQALKQHNVPHKIWLNTGGHGDNANSGTRQAAWRDELNRFWSQYLFGQNNNWTSGPRAAVQRSTNTWTDHDEWPLPEAVPAALKLTPVGDNSIGRLGTVVQPFSVSPLEVVVDDSITNATVHVAAAQSQSRLIYQTRPLTAPLHMSGLPTITLRMSFSKAAAVVSAMLVQYNANGSRQIISRGWTDPQNRHSIWETHAITPGTFYDIPFEFQPHDHIFPAGARLGLVLLGGDWEGDPPLVFTMRPPPGTVLTVDTANSTVLLPIVGGEAALIASSVAPPPAPAGLSASAVAGSVALTWTDLATTEDGFKIDRALDGVTFTEIGTVAANVTAFSDSSAIGGVTRHYRVRAYNSGGGDSGFTNVVDIGAPAITNGPTAGGDYQQPFTLAIAATYAPTGYDATGLPGGLSIDGGTGVISGVPSEAGNFAVTLTATNGLGTGAATVTFAIAPAAPALTWNGPAAVNYGTSLGISQLNAAADVPGSFAYVPPAGTVLAPGVHTLAVTFTPDSGNYATATGTVSIEVIAVPPSLVVPDPITVEATGAAGATVTFTATASDVVDPSLTPTCTPASGSTFALGTTTVACSATNSVGTSASTNFAVTVRDTTPPVLTLPAPIATEAGSQGTAAVSFTATALDSVDGPVGVQCVPASGFAFPIGTTTVQCASADTRANGVSGSFTVSVSNPLGRYVAFSREQTWLRERTTVVTGDIGANRPQAGPWHRRDRDDDGDRDDTVEVRIGERVRMLQPDSRVVGDTIWLRDRSSVYDVIYNELIDRSRSNAIAGDQTTPAPQPVLLMPVLPSIQPGRDDVKVGKNKTVTLPPGRYRNVRVQSRGKLILSGGLYQIESLEIDAEGTVRAQAATELRIKEELVTDSDASIVVANVSGLSARHFVIHVEGADDRCRHDGRFGRRHDDDDDAGQTAVHIGAESTIQANISAPNGTLWLKSETTATGSFVGRRVRIGRAVELRLDSAFQ